MPRLYRGAATRLVFKCATRHLAAIGPIVRACRRLQVTDLEPPSSVDHRVFIGVNSRGQWVAREEHGLYGGLFCHRTDALRYALFENGRRPEAVVETPFVLELDIDAHFAEGTAQGHARRQVA
jgi:hypothetical protein